MIGIGEHPRHIVGVGGIIVEVQGLHGVEKARGEGEGHLQGLGADARFQSEEGEGVDIVMDRVGDGHAVLGGIGGQGDGTLGKEQTDLHAGLLGG